MKSSADRAAHRPANPAPAPNSANRLVIGLGITQTLAWASSTYLPAILAVPMARDLGVSPGTVFAAYSAALLLMAALGPRIGGMIDRLGGRPVLCASNLVLAAALVLLGSAASAPLMFIAWCGLGVGMALGLYDAAFAALVRHFGQQARGPITGITLLGGFASTLGWPLTSALLDAVGWRGACFAWAAIHLLIALPINLRFLPGLADGTATTPDSVASASPSPAGGDLDLGSGSARATTADTASATAAAARRDARSDAVADSVSEGLSETASNTSSESASDTKPANPRRQLILLAVFGAATAFATSAMSAHLPGLLMLSGVGAAGALFAASLFGPAQVAARLFEYFVLHRRHLSPLLSARLATALHPAGAALLLTLGGSPAVAALFAVLHGAGNGMITIAKGTLPLALFGSGGYGARQGWLAVAQRIMLAIAPFSYGLVMLEFGARGALLLSTGVSLVALGALLGLRLTR